LLQPSNTFGTPPAAASRQGPAVREVVRLAPRRPPAGTYLVVSGKPRIEENIMVKLQELHPQYITDEDGKRTFVILPMVEFEELLEDIEDLASVAERREEPTISHEELVTEMKKDGLI
jgi:hypothetical protein